MTEAQEQYITLFCEGDGSVGLCTTPYGRYPQVSFDQKERDVLDCIALLTEGGRLYHGSQGCWKLVFNGSKCTSLLKIFSKHVVSRRFIARLDKALGVVGLLPATQHPLTLNGFVGFWDAEGSSDNSPSLFVSQKDREILDIISGSFGGGVSETKAISVWHLSGVKARGLFPEILSRSCCSAKAERLRNNFEGPSYRELHQEQRANYRDAHRDEICAYLRNYNREHLEERRIYNTEHADERRACRRSRNADDKRLREWMKEHPEEVSKIAERV